MIEAIMNLIKELNHADLTALSECIAIRRYKMVEAEAKKFAALKNI